jgi:hypothetical protein
MSFEDDDQHSVSRKRLLTAAASFGLLAAAAGVPAARATAPAQTRASVLGAWALESFDVIDPGKPRTPRFGPHPVGFLIYTPSGKMSATLSGITRPKFESTAAEPSAESRGQMLADFLSYAGTYDIRGDRVFHHVTVSVFTNLVGTTLERRFSLENDVLTIRTITPGMWGNDTILVWRRA